MFAVLLRCKLIRPTRSAQPTGGGPVHGEKVHVENEHGIRRDMVSCPCLSVGKLRRYEELPLRSGFHHLQGLGPAANHPVHRESSGLVPLSKLRTTFLTRHDPVRDRLGGFSLSSPIFRLSHRWPPRGRCRTTFLNGFFHVPCRQKPTDPPGCFLRAPFVVKA